MAAILSRPQWVKVGWRIFLTDLDHRRIGLDNGLSPVRCHTIIYTNAI